MFVTLKKGLSMIGETIAQRLPVGTLQLNTEITQIDKTPEGKWAVHLNNLSRNCNKKTTPPLRGTPPKEGNCGNFPVTIVESFAQQNNNSPPSEGWHFAEQNDGVVMHSQTRYPGNGMLTFDAIILAGSIADSAKVLKNSLPTLSEKLSAIEHEGTAIATFAFDSAQIKQEFRGMGFVVPKIEQSPILAGSFSSIKYEHRAPKGKFLIRVFAGGARNPALASMPEEQLVPLLLGELRKIINMDGEPLFSTVAHWANTMPQYNVGHRERIQEIESLVSTEPTLALAGNAFCGVGIPNCIHTGFVAAEKIAH
jgi:oxygen-dependent protoporphyrinogen oxidase